MDVFTAKMKWITALKSGAYNPTTGELNRIECSAGRVVVHGSKLFQPIQYSSHLKPDEWPLVESMRIGTPNAAGNCCLGVAVRVLGDPDVVGLWVRGAGPRPSMVSRAVELLTENAARGLGLGPDGEVCSDQTLLASMNDAGVPHRVIAEILLDQVITGLPIRDLVGDHWKRHDPDDQPEPCPGYAEN